jgi:hypothetical protein
VVFLTNSSHLARFVRVFRGHLHDGFVTGPLESRDFQMSGPVTSVSLFQSRGLPSCSLLLTCAVGRAVVVNGDVFDHSNKPEELLGADKFNSIFSGAAADIDLVRNACIGAVFNSTSDLLVLDPRTANLSC